MAPTSKRLKPNTDAVAVLPPDVIWEILLRLPARAIGRCRATCRSWHSLMSAPSFTRAYAARGPGFILALADAGNRLDMMDMSGVVVRRIRIPAEDIGAPHAGPGPLYLFPAKNRVRVMDPATREVSTLHVHDIGRRARSGVSPPPGNARSSSSVGTTVVGPSGSCATCSPSGGDGDQQYRWRQRPSPPIQVTTTDVCIHDVVIQGVAYFLAADGNRVASFDLETEEWRPATLPGPQLSDNYRCPQLQLAKLNHTDLVMVHSRRTTMDLWFARDLHKGIWVKEHSIKHNFRTSYLGSLELEDFRLLMVLEDGRIVFSYTKKGCRLGTYDPKTKAAPRVLKFGARSILGVYRGSVSCI